MKKQLVLLSLPFFSLNALAGGILLSEVATFDSVSSAGVGNALNRKDASAAITSPAGLTSIEDSSYSLGIQYIDVANTFHGEQPQAGSLKTKASGQQFAPSMAYARRISDSTVLGTSLHAEGGLGMEYTNGLSGLNLMDEMSITAINLNFAAGYQASSNLSLGGAIVVQHVVADLEASYESHRFAADGSSTAPGFMLSAMYDLSDSTYISANYKSQIDHRYKLEPNHNLPRMGTKTRWPAIVDLGISHNLSDQLNLKVRLAYEDWKAYGKADGKTMENVYSVGAALSYAQDRWTYQTGFRYDTRMVKEKHMEPDLSIGRQWAFGLGAEKQLNNNHRLGIAYEYRDMGEPEVHYGLTDIKGKFSRNRLHFVSLSYAY
ncbi:OmpP1/FadL family transporter [Endozoicomonas lisbonensis]|uniref:Long-chain fatty acid transport protein n=1 Tax=Endozoicomonas lisbonensis TaxID=3120522 RepID=A0ABV2SBP1_9GAMM